MTIRAIPLLLLATSVSAQTAPDFSDLSLDQLANIKITSFTNKQQQLSKVAGAVYVITQEQIARSGLTSVPGLLRLVPGLDVAHVNGNQWSVSARGPVGVYANKLLVLIDGRSVYSPVFSGVYWDLGMPLLDDIERIEVIRGPGATIWGANAVLGVINIITKSARDSHGATITASTGTAERGMGSVHTGGTIGSTSYSVHFGGADNAPLALPGGGTANDGWSSVQGGLRLDGSYKKDSWMLEGDLFRGMENETGLNVSLPTQSFVFAPAAFNTVAGSLTGEWRHRLGGTRELRFQSYYDYANRPEPQASRVETSTWDVGLRYDFTLEHIHNLSVGAGTRMIAASVDSQENAFFTPSSLTYSNENVFAQDEMHFAHDALLFTVGAKLEHNHFSGWGSEPSANLLWMPAKHHSLWISAARSLRTPTLFETGVTAELSMAPASAATGGLPIVVYAVGTPAFRNESVRDFEAGYRAQLSKSFSTDIALFYDQYSDIRSFTGSAPSVAFAPIPHLDAIETFSNNGAGAGKGAEASVAWQMISRWKLEGSYTFNTVNIWLAPSAPLGSIEAEGNPPARNKWRLQSYLNLSRSIHLDTFLYSSSQGSPRSPYGPDLLIPAYTRLDIRLGYKVNRRWELSLAGQNLLEPRHLEGRPELLSYYSYVTRGVYLKSTWQF